MSDVINPTQAGPAADESTEFTHTIRHVDEDGRVYEVHLVESHRSEIAGDSAAIGLIADVLREMVRDDIRARAATVSLEYPISKRAIAAAAPMASDPSLDTVLVTIPPAPVQAEIVLSDEGVFVRCANTVVARLRAHNIIPPA